MLKAILILTTLLSLSALAEFKSTNDAIEKMRSYSPTYFAEIRDEATQAEDNEEAQDVVTEDKMDTFFIDLEGAIKLLTTQKKIDPVLYEEVLRVASLSLDNDPTWFAGDLVLPLYKKDKEFFTENLKKLSEKSARNLEEAVKNSALEDAEGNG